MKPLRTMPHMPRAFRPKSGRLSDQDRRDRERDYDRRRERVVETRVLYRSMRWRRLRQQQLQAEPLCRTCDEVGVITPATICDHVEPHRGDPVKFWAGPFQSLCKPCHDTVKQREEATTR